MIPGIISAQALAEAAEDDEGALTGITSLTFTPAANLAALAAGELSGITNLTFIPAADLAASAALSGTAALIFTPTADLEAGSGELSGTIGLTFAIAGDLSTGVARLWRVNITAVDGGTFISCAEAKWSPTIGGANYCLDAIKTYSAESTFAGLNANNAGDYNFATAWSAATDPTAWFKIDLGAAVAVDQVAIIPVSTSLTQAPKDFTIEWSDDNSAWTVALTVTGETGWLTDVARFFVVSGTHRYWRIVTTAVDGGTNFAMTEFVLRYTDYHGSTSASTTRTCRVTATSEFAGNPAQNAVDGSTGTGWTIGSGTTGFLQFDFIREIALTQLKWTSRSGEGNRSPKDFTIEYSTNNGSTWKVVKTVTNETGWGSLEERTFTW